VKIMLGWKIYITQESSADKSKSLMSWSSGIGGLDWLDQLVKDGLAQDLGGNGYPSKYSAKASVLLPKVVPVLPNYEGKFVIGDDYVLEGGEHWEIKIDQSQIDACSPDETLLIEAWDES
jgi:hypothetical protein